MAEIPIAAKLAAGTAFVDVPLSTVEYNMRAHVVMHDVQDSDGNPCLIYRHGGSGTGRDARLPFISSGNGNAIFDHLLLRKTKPDDLHFTCISIQTPQNEYSDSVSLTRHSEDETIGWTASPRTRPTNFPYNVYAMQAAILAVKARAREWNINPNKIFLMGTSYGSVLTALSQLFPPLTPATPGIHTFGTNVPPGSYDSRVRGVIAHQFTPDFRTAVPNARGNGVHRTVSGASWDDATYKITSTGAFDGMTTEEHAGTPVYIYNGTDQTNGRYWIVDIVDDDNAIIDRSCGAAATNLTFLMSTETLSPSYITGFYGRPRVNSSSEYADILSMNPEVRASGSPQAYVESGNYPPWACPIYACTENLGNGAKPYGEAATEAAGMGTQDVHDKQYIVDWINACMLNNVPAYGDVFSETDWESEHDKSRRTTSERVYNWMAAMLNGQQYETPEFGGVIPNVRVKGY